MEITLDPELERVLLEESRRQGQSPEVLVRDALEERFLGKSSTSKPRDDWERKLLGVRLGIAGSPCRHRP